MNLPANSPLSRAPRPLQAAHAAAQARFVSDPSQANWLALRAIIAEAIELDDQAKGRRAA